MVDDRLHPSPANDYLLLHGSKWTSSVGYQRIYTVVFHEVKKPEHTRRDDLSACLVLRSHALYRNRCGADSHAGSRASISGFGHRTVTTKTLRTDHFTSDL